MRRPFAMLGSALGFLIVCSSSSIGAQTPAHRINPPSAPATMSALAVTNATTATPPATCYARLPDEPEGGFGLYWWDQPQCSTARARWSDEHSASAIAAQGPPSGETLELMSSAVSSQIPEVDRTNHVFVTAGLKQLPRNTQTVWLPKGTVFPVHTMQSYSTYEASPQDRVRFELDQDVTVNGVLVAMKGDTAEGSFPNVKTARSFFFVSTGGGLFHVSVDTIYNFCGDKIDVDFDRTEYRSKRLGLFGADVDQHIIRGQQYLSFTAKPQKVCGVPSAKTNSAVPASSLYPTTH